MGEARMVEAKEDERTGPKEGGRPASPSGAGEARSGSSATRAVAGGPCRTRARVDGNGEGHALEENVGGSERSEADGVSAAMPSEAASRAHAGVKQAGGR